MNKFVHDRKCLRYFQIALVRFNNLHIHYIFILFNCVSMSKIPIPPPQVKTLSQVSGRLHFLLFQKKLYILFFNFLFDIFQNSINLDHVSQLGDKDLVYDYIFTSQRILLCSRYEFFCYTFIYFFPFGVTENKATKSKFKCFNGSCDCSSYPGWSILFLYAPVHIIIELVYRCILRQF